MLIRTASEQAKAPQDRLASANACCAADARFDAHDGTTLLAVYRGRPNRRNRMRQP